jgi:hypothetical protein
MSRENRVRTMCLAFTLCLSSAAILFLSAGPFVGKAEGLIINGDHTITGEESYDEDITITGTGHLRVLDGGTLKMGIGHNIYVNSGSLSVIGNSSVRSSITCSSLGGRFGGIYANSNAKLNFTYADLRWANEMLVCDGTGRSASTGRVVMVETYVSQSRNGLRFGDGVPSHPYDVRFLNNHIQTSERCLDITTAYNDIQVIGSIFYSGQGDAVRIFGGGGGGGAGRIADCNIIGLLEGLIITNHQKMELANCTIGGHLGLRLEKVYGFYVHNNSVQSEYRAMYGYSLDTCRIEDNSFQALRYRTSIAVELEQTSDNEFRDNILSSRGYTMTMNTSSMDRVEMNLLTNLVDRDYQDLDGDGFCDNDPLLPGNAMMYAKRCRTSIVPLDGTGPTYVNPKMATDYAEEGEKLFMYCFPK